MNDGLIRRCAAEGIGTFFLVLIGPGAVMVDAYTEGTIGHAGVALAFGFVVLAMVYALGRVSGAHINPAVTIALWSARRFQARDVGPYIFAQCGRAMLASFFLRTILGPVGALGATRPTIPIASAFAIEWVLSLALMLVILAVVSDEQVTPGFAGMAIGLTVGVAALMGGPLTGASMNPARSLGPAVAGGIWTAHWIYWVAPVTAMLAAARISDFLRLAGMGGRPLPEGSPQAPIDMKPDVNVPESRLYRVQRHGGA